MKRLRTIATVGAMSIAGLGLIGAGAHAVFTTSTTSSQTINAGTLDVVLSASGAGGNGTSTISLATPAAVGSSFTTGDQLVEMSNVGNIPATESTLTVTGVTTIGADNTLLDGLQLCVATNNNVVVYNGPLTTASSTSPLTYYGGLTIAAGSADYYIVNVYAGNEPTICGNDGASAYADTYGSDSTSSSASLGNGAQGEAVEYSLTVGYTG